MSAPCCGADHCVRCGSDDHELSACPSAETVILGLPVTVCPNMTPGTLEVTSGPATRAVFDIGTERGPLDDKRRARLEGFAGQAVVEALRAAKKHGNRAMIGSGLSTGDRLGIIGEELGEVGEEVLRLAGLTAQIGQVCRATTYDEGSRDELRKELVQLAAMCLAWLAAEL